MSRNSWNDGDIITQDAIQQLSNEVYRQNHPGVFERPIDERKVALIFIGFVHRIRHPRRRSFYEWIRGWPKALAIFLLTFFIWCAFGVLQQPPGVTLTSFLPTAWSAFIHSFVGMPYPTDDNFGRFWLIGWGGIYWIFGFFNWCLNGLPEEVAQWAKREQVFGGPRQESVVERIRREAGVSKEKGGYLKRVK